jgi:hypothetical protein
MMVVFVVYWPNDAIAAETALPKLTFAASWLHEKLFDVPAVQVAFWSLVWLIDEDAVALVDGGFEVGSVPRPPVYACAAETALPLLKFIANWLHDAVFDVPAVQVALWVFDWLIEDVALALVLGLDVDVCANAAFDVVATTRNPAAITAATIVNNFVVLMILYHVPSSIVGLYIKVLM